MHHVCDCETCPRRLHSVGPYPCWGTLNVNQTLNVKCNVNGNLQQACLTWLACPVCCRYSHLLLLPASCLPAPCQCLSMDYTLSACLHVTLQLLPRLLAEQASPSDGHCGANEKTAFFFSPVNTKQDLWETCLGLAHHFISFLFLDILLLL